MIDFTKVNRVIVHNIDDLNRLKDLGYIQNVTLFPHGVLDFESNIKPQKNLIATYGFFLPHKGLIETIKAMKILKDKGFNYKLKMLNAEYPVEISKNLINEAKQLIKELNLTKNIELITEFLEDKKCLEELAKAQVVIFPYQETGESASGAVRYALAANRDILVTPLKIFDDVKECGFTLNGFTPEAIANGIIKYFNEKNTSKVKEYRNKWLNTHRYSKIGPKLENIIKSIYINEP
jgi:glycosyltransferase involved in cell wall biosynthesis